MEIDKDNHFEDHIKNKINTALEKNPPIYVVNNEVTHDLTKIPKTQLINNLLVMAIKWRHNTTHTVAQDILKLVNISSKTNDSKSSKYYWKIILERYSQRVSTHYICNNCDSYLGCEHNRPDICDSCQLTVDYESNKGSFLQIPLKDQLRDLFEQTDSHNLYSRTRQKINRYAFEDIYDGKMYKKQVYDENMISINFSVDGAPVFESSNTSVYPVLCTVNELNPIDRRNNILLSSIWFGVGKPKDMNSYLKPFVTEAKNLLKDGFSYCYKNQIYKKKVVVLMGVCDSVARPLVRCSTQFNGTYGCGLCLNQGKSVKKGKGCTRVYPIINGNPFGEGLRNHEDTLLHSKQKKKLKRKGIKKISILCDLPTYDIINNLDADWMHCVGLGVCRQFANLWFDKKNCNEEFYFGDIIDSIDSCITSFRPTSDISRTPRPLSDRVHMKAHEWIVFLLVYSLPLLKIFFTKKFVDHWALLVEGTSILVKKSILKSEVKYAAECLNEFILGVQSLYGEKYMSFNVHLLSHLAISVENWGPLYTHSAFIYEDFNQTILAYVKSPNGVELQICDSFRLKCVIDQLSRLHWNDLDYHQKQFLEKILQKKTKPQSNFRINNCKILGKSTILNQLSANQNLAIARSNIEIDENSKIFTFNRCIINNETVTSKTYNREKKRINYIVLLQNNQIFEINSFIGLKSNFNEKSYLFGYYYSLKNEPFIADRKLDHLVVLENKINTLEAVSTESISKKVVVLEMEQFNFFVACLPTCEIELLT